MLSFTKYNLARQFMVVCFLRLMIGIRNSEVGAKVFGIQERLRKSLSRVKRELKQRIFSTFHMGYCVR